MQVQGGGLSASDVVLIVDPTVACPAASVASTVVGTRGVTVGSSTLNGSAAVTLTGAVPGVYSVCVQPGGTGDFVQVPGVLTVKGASGFSPSAISAVTMTGVAPAVLTLSGFGFGSGDSVRIVGSADSCGTATSSVNNIMVSGVSMSTAGSSSAFVSLSYVPPGVYKVCLQQVGQTAASAVPGNSLIVRGVTSFAPSTVLLPSPVAPTTANTVSTFVVLTGSGMSTLDTIKIIDGPSNTSSGTSVVPSCATSNASSMIIGTPVFSGSGK